MFISLLFLFNVLSANAADLEFTIPCGDEAIRVTLGDLNGDFATWSKEAMVYDKKARRLALTVQTPPVMLTTSAGGRVYADLVSDDAIGSRFNINSADQNVKNPNELSDQAQGKPGFFTLFGRVGSTDDLVRVVFQAGQPARAIAGANANVLCPKASLFN